MRGKKIVLAFAVCRGGPHSTKRRCRYTYTVPSSLSKLLSWTNIRAAQAETITITQHKYYGEKITLPQPPQQFANHQDFTTHNTYEVSYTRMVQECLPDSLSRSPVGVLRS